MLESAMPFPQTPYAPKMGTLVNLNRVVVPSKAQASLSVAVRVRPILNFEQAGNKRDIVRVIDGKIVVILDPDEVKDYLDQVQNRTKEKKYTFDVAFDTKARNSDVYAGSIQELAAGVSRGLNGTVFAYGATGSGKTHTMVGTQGDPGLMVLSLSQIFQEKAANADLAEEFAVTCSYLEVYNEVIYDLLVKNSGPLELREDPDQGMCVAGLKHISVTSAAETMGLLEEGNRRRKTDSTDANAASSRSHAVLEIVVRRCARNQYRANVLIGKLTLVDLAGSERAAETNNAGQKLRDGANINKSLLALANCINALGKQQKTGVAYVPYRNSKLTRLLKDSLRGNSRTAMVATIGAAADQYHNSVNTLKYADRAKEIKTHVVQNVGTVERHITDYQNIIDNLQTEVQSLRARLGGNMPGGSVGVSATNIDDIIAAAATAAATGGVNAAGNSNKGGGISGGSLTVEADTLAWIDALAQEINDNVEERINLQKALFELEDVNVCNKYELQNIEDSIKDSSLSPDEAAEAQERRTVLLEDIQANNSEAEQCRADIAANEASRRDIQAKIENAIDTNSNVNFLKILSTFRIQAVRLQELKFQMAVRDQIINEQRDVISNLWQILGASGLSRQQVVDIARAQGIVLQGIEHDDLSDASANGASGPTGAPPTVGSSARLSALGSLPLTSTNGGIPPAAAGDNRYNDSGVDNQAAGGAGVQLSLMGGKARYRYKFWQQYKGLEHQSSSGISSPLQALQAPLLMQHPTNNHRSNQPDAVGGVSPSSSVRSLAPLVPKFNNLTPQSNRLPQQLQQSHQQLQEVQRRRTSRRGPDHTADSQAGSGAAAGHAAAGGGMKRYNLPPVLQQHHQQQHQAVASPALNHRRYSSADAGHAAHDASSASHGSSRPQQQHQQQYGLVASHSSSSVAGNPYDPGSGRTPGRWKHKGAKRKGLPPVPGAVSTPHPGLPGQQKQLEHTIQALRQARQQAAAKAIPGGQQQQLQSPMLAHGPPPHGGVLAWQETGPGALPTQHLKQLQRERQLSSVYGANPLGDKLAKLKKRNHVHKFSSAGVSAEPSYTDLASERSGSSALPAINEGSKPLDALRRKTALQQLQSLWHRKSQY